MGQNSVQMFNAAGGGLWECGRSIGQVWSWEIGQVGAGVSDCSGGAGRALSGDVGIAETMVLRSDETRSLPEGAKKAQIGRNECRRRRQGGKGMDDRS